MCTAEKPYFGDHGKVIPWGPWESLRGEIGREESLEHKSIENTSVASEGKITYPPTDLAASVHPSREAFHLPGHLLFRRGTAGGCPWYLGVSKDANQQGRADLGRRTLEVRAWGYGSSLRGRLYRLSTVQSVKQSLWISA